MPRIKGTTDAQSKFLRAFHTSPDGPAPADWPSPAVLRRWLRHPEFLRAFNSLQSTVRAQADFQLRAASASAIRSLATLLAAAPNAESQKQFKTLCDFVRLAHQRERFAPQSLPAPPTPVAELKAMLRSAKRYLDGPGILKMIEAGEFLNPKTRRVAA